MATRATEATLRPTSRGHTRVARRRNRNLPQRILFSVALITLAIASTYSALALVSKVWPALFPGQTFSLPGLEAVPLPSASNDSSFNKRVNLLIIGLDARPGEELLDAHLTDVVMVATIDPVAKETSLLSIPRDFYINITHPDGSTEMDRINTSYGRGIVREGSFEGGAKQLQTDLKNNFGIETDYWVVVDFKGVQGLVDALGGVDVTIPPELEVPPWQYHDDDQSPKILVEYPEGPYHFDGYNAVAFGRYRETDDDLHRVKRQQLIVTAAISKIFERGLLNNPADLWGAYNDMVHTNVPEVKMIGLAPLVRDTNGRVRTFSLGDPVNGTLTADNYTTPGGASVLVWDVENVQYILAQVFTKAVYSNSNVEIENAFGAGGDIRSQALGRYLIFKGLPRVYMGEDLDPQGNTQILLYDAARREMAEDIAEWMQVDPGIIVDVQATEENLPDIQVIVGQDFVLPE